MSVENQIDSYPPAPEQLSQEELTPIIKDRIKKIVDLVSPTDELKHKGFEYFVEFDQVEDIPSGRMEFSYYPYADTYEYEGFLEFYKFYDADNVLGISLTYQSFDLSQQGISYYEWDEEKQDSKQIKPPDNTREALFCIDALIESFKTAVDEGNHQEGFFPLRTRNR